MSYRCILFYYFRCMYNVPHFKAAGNEEVIAFMQQHPFVILCAVAADNTPVATHIPVLLEQRDDRIFLRGHVMRKQEHTKAFESNANVLVIFSGAHTYVSASWYTNKQTASTWNYQAVHAKGALHFLDDAGLHDTLTKLTAAFENASSPSLVENMDAAYISNMMKAIIAFEIEITEVQHVFKLSQNRDKQSYDTIIEELSKKDDDSKVIADTMQQRKQNVFPS